MEMFANKGVAPRLSSSTTESQYLEHNVIGLLEYKEERSLRASIRITGSKRLEIPEFLINQISCCEKLCSCCIFSCFFSKSNRIVNIEGRNLDTYYNQKANLESEYISQNPNHEDSLRFLFLNSLNCNLTNDLRSENWKHLGFVTNDPRNEFAGGGYFALLFLTHFIKQFEIDFQSHQDKVSFASIGITLCFYAKLALDYINEEVDSDALRSQHKIKPVTINQFINFIDHLSTDDNYLYNLLAKILLQIIKELAHKDLNMNSTMIPNYYAQTIREPFNSIFYTELNTLPDSLSSRTSSMG